MDVYKTLNGVETHLIVWGDVFGTTDSDVILCVIGCPGIPVFYKEFGEEIHKRTKLPLCLIGHAGHDIIPEEEKNEKCRKKHEESNITSYDINSQIDHKLDLINYHIKTTKRLHLIGHSLGTWLLVEMLNKNEYLIQKTASIHLLFPTLQKLGETPMGRHVTLLRKIHSLVILFLALLEILPNSIKSFITNIVLKVYSLPSHYIERILIYTNPRIEDNALKLAYELIDKSTQLNITAMDKIKHITHVLHSPRDHWTQKQHIEDLKMFQPELQLSEMNVSHTFVLKSHVRVAKYVSDSLRKKM